MTLKMSRSNDYEGIKYLKMSGIKAVIFCLHSKNRVSTLKGKTQNKTNKTETKI